ncbi:MFS transporter [Micromonospora sp. NPDC000663]|uniref:MFS transporter n=1 Tax=Micromonospora sp. NPDC000663 TaxID=3364218 RepID=UPI0036C9FB35
MRRFSIIWAGQLVTLIGNSVLRFAFVVQAWTSGQRATAVVLLSVLAVVPQVLLSPTAGALVDRLRKRTALQLADIGGLAVVGALAALHFSGHLQLWQIYVAVALLGAAAAFQYPALFSAIPLLVAKDQLQRANGLLGTARSTAEICGPALAGVLVATSGLGTILLVDLLSFVLALLTIQAAGLHEQPRDGATVEPRRRLGAESLDGLRYLFVRPSLRGLVIVIFVVNLVMVFGYAIVQPMILARTGNDASALASVMASIGVGGILGGLLMGVWGGPKARIRGMLLGVVGMCLTSQVLVAASRDVPAWCAAILVGALLMPIVNGTMQAIIQTKVPPQRQGRVFGAVMFVSQISAPLAMVCSGLVADRVFEPQAAAGTGLVGLLQPVVGSGPGSGMAAMLLIAGACGMAVAVWGMANRQVRDIDVILPDWDGIAEQKEERKVPT